jgi:hypothetical protein
MKKICTLLFLLLFARAGLSYGASPAFEVPTEGMVVSNPIILFDYYDRSYAKVTDYTVTMFKKEILKGKEYPEEILLIKYMKPGVLRIDWADETNKGIWGLYDIRLDVDHFWAHDIGWRGVFGTMKFSLDSEFTQIFHPNRFVATDAHLDGMAGQVRVAMLGARDLAKLKIEYRGIVPAPVTGRKSFFVHAYLSPDPADKLLCAESDLYVDIETSLIMNVTMYGWKNKDLLGRYLYKDLKFNVGLTDADFKKE